MPILSIKALAQKDPSLIEPALKKTTVAIAKAYGCKPEQVWATWIDLPTGRYVEGENSLSIQPDETHPPICELLCFEGKSDSEIEKLLEVTSKTLCEGLNLKDNIFITYHEASSGRVIAGNGIVRKKS